MSGGWSCGWRLGPVSGGCIPLVEAVSREWRLGPVSGGWSCEWRLGPVTGGWSCGWRLDPLGWSYPDRSL